MTALWITLALVALVAAAAAWQRRQLRSARERSARQLEELLAVRRPASRAVVTGPRSLRLELDGGPAVTVDLARLARTADGGGERSRQRLLRSLVDTAAAAPRPLGSAYELKRHGLATLPRLAAEGLAPLALEPAPARFTEPASGLTVIYRVEGEDGLAYVSADHLGETGIDERDLHGVALAVLRQRFDGAELRSLLIDTGAARVEPDDGCGGSRLFLLPEALAAGESWFAATPSPALLVVAVDRQRLHREIAACGERPEPLPPAIFRVSAAGLRRAS